MTLCCGVGCQDVDHGLADLQREIGMLGAREGFR